MVHKIVLPFHFIMGAKHGIIESELAPLLRTAVQQIKYALERLHVPKAEQEDLLQPDPSNLQPFVKAAIRLGPLLTKSDGDPGVIALHGPEEKHFAQNVVTKLGRCLTGSSSSFKQRVWAFLYHAYTVFMLGFILLSYNATIASIGTPPERGDFIRIQKANMRLIAQTLLDNYFTPPQARFIKYYLDKYTPFGIERGIPNALRLFIEDLSKIYYGGAAKGGRTPKNKQNTLRFEDVFPDTALQRSVMLP